MFQIIFFRGLFFRALFYGLIPAFIFVGFLEARAQEDSVVTGRMSDLFSTKSIDIDVFEETPASLSTEKEFSDEVYPEDEMEPVEPDELQYLSEREIQECAVRFPGSVRVKVMTSPRSHFDLEQNDVIALKVRTRHKAVRIKVSENKHAASAKDQIGSYVRGMCVFNGKAQTRVNVSLSKVVLDQLALFENGFRTITSVHVEQWAKLVSIAQNNKNPKSMVTIMGDGLYACPAIRKDRFRCVSG